jgi:hypothetical protein
VTTGWSSALGVVSMIGATIAYNLGIILLALVARAESKTQDRRSLITHVVERAQGSLSIGLSMVGWVLEIVALTQISVTLERVIYAAGFGLMLVLARWRLGETMSRLEAVGIMAIAIGMVGVGIEAPAASNVGLNLIGWSVLTAVVIPVIFLPDIAGRFWNFSAPFMSGIGAGLGYASTNLYSKGVSEFLSPETLVPLTLLAIGAAVTSIVAFSDQIRALQAGRATAIVPIIGGLQAIVPIIVASFVFGEKWPATLAGQLVLGGGILLSIVGMAVLAYSSAQIVHGVQATDADGEALERRSAETGAEPSPG